MSLAALGNPPDKIRAWPWPLKAVSAFASGAVIVAAQPPWGAWPLLFIGFSAFYALLCSIKTARAAFAYGWLFGFGYFAFGLSWIANALLVKGNEDYVWAWPLAVAGLPALLAMFTAAASALPVRFSNLRRPGGFCLFIAAIMASEWLRGHLFTGFPWNLYGYIWGVSLPMAQLSAIGGIYLLSLITLIWSALPGFLLVWQGERKLKAALFLAVVATMAAAYGYGRHRLGSNPTVLRPDVVVRLIQPNIEQENKWDPARATENFDRLVDLSRPEPVNQSLKTIIVWPETALSQAYVMQNHSRAQTAMERLVTSYHAPVYLVTGMMRFERDEKGRVDYYNSLVAFNSNLEAINTYNKSHLVPFGEYIPLQKWIPLAPFVQFAGFTPGNGPETDTLPGIGNYSPLVCYEIIFPGAVTAQKPRPDFIVNVTNDAWYGDSAGPYQHFVKAQFRAIEEGIPVIRAANTGISGIIDPEGRAIVRNSLFKTAATNANLPQPLVSPTPYSHWRDTLFFACLIALLSLFVYESCNGHFSRIG